MKGMNTKRLGPVAHIIFFLLALVGGFLLASFLFPERVEDSKAVTLSLEPETVEIDELEPLVASSTLASTTIIHDELALLESAQKSELFIEIIDTCGPYHEGECVNLRSGPSTSSPSVMKLRSGIILRVKEKIERDGEVWYAIRQDTYLRHPDRVAGTWYVSGQFAREFYDAGDRELARGERASSSKRIVVDISDQILYAYEGEELFMEERVSTGLAVSPTPRGTFVVFKKMPSRYMQGPIPGITEQYYDLPGVPWNLYFTHEGAVIHGAYWHDKFGKRWSRGCVNLPPEKAKELYFWADLGTAVFVRT